MPARQITRKSSGRCPRAKTAQTPVQHLDWTGVQTVNAYMAWYILNHYGMGLSGSYNGSKLEFYHPRNPQDSHLWNLMHDHFDDFMHGYDENFIKEYGYFRTIIPEVVNEYLKCGDLKEGFTRIRCPDCGHEQLLAFSCRCRWFCLSCHGKRVVLFGEHLRENVLYPVPHRQYVFSIPTILRKFFLYNRPLLAELCHCAQDSLLTFFKTGIGLDDGISVAFE